jgi:hypothetical protein
MFWCLLIACIGLSPEGGQQGEDLLPDDSAGLEDNDTDAAADSAEDTAETPYEGTIDLLVDGSPCAGPILLREDATGTCSCTAESGVAFNAVLTGARTDDTASGTVDPEGTFDALYVGDSVSGTLTGTGYSGTFTASR